MKIKYTLLEREANTKARLGKIQTNYGTFDTPMFMPVGTLATVKTLSPEELKDIHFDKVYSSPLKRSYQTAYLSLLFLPLLLLFLPPVSVFFPGFFLLAFIFLSVLLSLLFYGKSL